MGSKLTFQPLTRLAQVTLAPDVNDLIVLDVKVDLYSDAKEDWLAIPALARMRFPIRPIGGDTIPIGVIGDSYVMTDGWKIAPFEADHTLRIDGNLFALEDPLVTDTIGSFRVRVQEKVSTLVEVRIDTTQKADLGLVRKILFNRLETNPVTGIMTLYDDDNTTVLQTWDIWEDIAQIQRYRSQGMERRDLI